MKIRYNGLPREPRSGLPAHAGVSRQVADLTPKLLLIHEEPDVRIDR